MQSGGGGGGALITGQAGWLTLEPGLRVGRAPAR